MVGLIAINSILRECALAPGVDASHTVNVEIDVQIDESSTLDLVWMGCTLEVFLTVVPSTDTEGLMTFDSQC